MKGDSLVFLAQESWDEGPCTITLVLELRALRQGDVVSGAGEWRIETSGTCGGDGSVAPPTTIPWYSYTSRSTCSSIPDMPPPRPPCTSA